jgi:hypothetical protein
MKVLRMQVYLLNILKSDAFPNLTLQDKLSSIARIIDIQLPDFDLGPKS